MKYPYYNKKINRKTKGRCDVTPLFEDPTVFSRLVSDLIKPFSKTKYNKVAGLDALGFVLASAVSLKTKKPLVLIRKEGKLPGLKKTSTSFIDYSRHKKTFEINKSSISKGDRVLIVDEWIETGTQAKAAIKLIEKLGGKVAGIAVINADLNKKTKILFDKYNLKPLNVSK
ncbi:MAG: adenine phosphoribosyltransferase [Colwelliaceae bacterium]|nr:adenine phosphoribosyltransferase [Colwelliaceae bacterium]|tara:strand:+ start:2323 stop:2835 length:513 start_codon:yes stop_codon:yes gene_type:complete